MTTTTVALLRPRRPAIFPDSPAKLMGNFQTIYEEMELRRVP